MKLETKTHPPQANNLWFVNWKPGPKITLNLKFEFNNKQLDLAI